MSWRRYPEYKESGVEWLGEVPRHWEMKRLKHISRLQTGITLGKKYENKELETRPYIRVANVQDGYLDLETIKEIELPPEDAPRHELKDGDVLMTEGGDFDKLGRGYVWENNIPGCLHQNHIFAVRPLKDRLDSFFLAALMSSSHGKTYFTSTSQQTTNLATTNRTKLGDFPVPVPPNDEQTAIADFLDRETARLDALIEKKQRQMALLEEKRSALISHAVTKGLDPGARMKDSGIEWLGEIPEHWEVKRLKKVIGNSGSAIKTGPFGSQLLSSEMEQGTIKVYNQQNVIERDLSLGENYISEEKYDELKSFTIFPGDVLITTRGTIGRVLLFTEKAEKGILHPCLMRIQTNHDLLIPQYLALLIQDSDIIIPQLENMSDATTIDVIYSNSLKSVYLPIPSVKEQNAVLNYLKKRWAQLTM